MCFWMGPEALPVYIADAVLAHMYRYRQIQPTDREAGGGIFMAHADQGLIIAAATGPYPSDTRGRYHYKVDETLLNRDIDRLRRAEQFFVGMWHTHPEEYPRPSRRDVEAMRRLFCNNDHALAAMVLLIVGRAAAPHGLWLSLHTATAHERVLLQIVHDEQASSQDR